MSSSKITTEQDTEAIIALRNMRLKEIIVYVLLTLIVMFAILFVVVVFVKQSWELAGIIGGIETMSIYTIKPLTAHYFPALFESIKENRKLKNIDLH